MINISKLWHQPMARGLIVAGIALLAVVTIVSAATTIGTNITTTGSLNITRSLSSQTEENNNGVLSLTTDSTYITGSDITYSSARGSSAMKITGVYSGVNGGSSNIYSLATNSGAHTDAGAGVIGVKGVAVNTAALTDGNIYGAQFIAKHNHATNAMANEAALIGLEGWAYDSGAAPAGTAIGANLGYHNEGTTAKGAGSVYRGVQIFTDDAAGSEGAVERTSLALWNQAGTQTNGIKFIKSDGGWTNDITLQNGESINNVIDGVIKINATPSFNGYATSTAEGVLMTVNKATAPVTCGATYKGGLAFNNVGNLCVCNGVAWVIVSSTAGTACPGF